MSPKQITSANKTRKLPVLEAVADGELDGNEAPEPLFILNCDISRNGCIISKVISIMNNEDIYTCVYLCIFFTVLDDNREI